jgi:hypothetical protein
MSIEYFPNRVFKKTVPAIDRVMAERTPRLVRGYQDITSKALDVVISANSNWQINAIKFTFANATSRNYSATVMGGVKVVANLNDSLWFQSSNSLWQQINLTPDFYTGDNLAQELENQLNANTAFSDLGLSFTVSYDSTTGLFEIDVSGGTIRYIQQNNTQRLPTRDSTAGHLFGFTVTTGYDSTLVSDTPVFGLNQEAWIINEKASVVTQDYSDDIHILNIDEAIHLTTNTAATAVSYEIQYEEMV